jgi:hypothetical protein
VNPAYDDAHSAYQRANLYAWVSTVAIGAGVLGLGVGTYLVLTARVTRTSAIRLTPLPTASGGSVVLGGRF